MMNKLRLFVVVFLVGLVVACEQGEVALMTTATTIPVTAVSPTALSPSTTPTQTPSATATTIPTTTPTQTPTATTIPTLTPLPTFTPEELETAVAALLANPMNCDVPCWWDAIPGETTIDEIKYAIAPYNFDIYEYYDEEGNEYFRLGIGHVEERNDFEVRIVFGFSDSILAGVTAYSASVSEILAKYGQPDEVWFEAMSYEREGNLSVRLNLVYLQDGMAVGYVVDGHIQDKLATGCFADKESGRLFLLEPNTATNYKDFTPIFSLERHYLPLEEATKLTIEEFMQQFSDPTQPQCLETPTELWD